MDLPSPTTETSGRVFTGQLKYYWETYDTNQVKTGGSDATVEVSSGGFFDSDQLVKGDGTSCDTCYPTAATAGESPYKLTLLPDGNIEGFNVSCEPIRGRPYMEIHYRIRQTLGSSGCIVFVNGPPCPDDETLSPVD